MPPGTSGAPKIVPKLPTALEAPAIASWASGEPVSAMDLIPAEAAPPTEKRSKPDVDAE